MFIISVQTFLCILKKMSDGSASLCYSKVSCLRSVVYTTRTTV